MPTRTQTAKRPASGRFARPAQKPTQRQPRGRRAPSSRRPTMPSVVNRRTPEKSGAAKAAEKLGGLLPGTRGQKSGGSGGRGKKGTAGLALLAGAAGLLIKNREKVASMFGHKDTADGAVEPVAPAAVPSNSGPVDASRVGHPAPSADQPTD